MNRHAIIIGLVLLFAVFCWPVEAEEKQYSAPGIGFIEVRSDINGARVYFDTLYMGYVSGGILTIPVDTTVHPSWKNVRVEYSGYAPFAGPFVQTEAGKTIAYSIQLKKDSYEKMGIIQFFSNPPGAELLLNNISQGSTPDSGLLVDYTVPRGIYTISARRPGDTTITDQVYVDANAVTNYRVDMVPSPLGGLQVLSHPNGAEIYLDNVIRGLTPLTLSDISVGEHTIEMRKQGYQDWIANVSIIGGSTGSIDAVLVTLPTPTPVPPVNKDNQSEEGENVVSQKN